MKTTRIEKTLNSGEITNDQLKEISKFTRRAMKAEELYVFSLILCDNSIDRDRECFSTKALYKLAELYKGKTGIFDHLPRAENQSARIFKTEVRPTGESGANGEAGFALKAWAYMVRCEKNRDLILEIDGGIKKEVSVGCSVGKISCSVCGANLKENQCAHVKGKVYSGEECYHILEEPQDAYEWSFVAVPAQKNAGVVKGYATNKPPSADIGDRLKFAAGEVTLTKSEAVSLSKYICKLKALARAGEEYSGELRKSIILNASRAQPELDMKVFEDICSVATLEQLKSMHKSYAKAVQGKYPVVTQLAQPGEKENKQAEFKI